MLRTVSIDDAGGSGAEALAEGPQLWLLPRSPRRILGARSTEEIRGHLAAALAGLYAGCRPALYVRDGDRLVPVSSGGRSRWEALEELLAVIRCRAAVEGRPLGAPQLFAHVAGRPERAVMTAPLQDAEGFAGLLIVEAASDGREFHALDLVLVESLAAQASLALERIRANEHHRVQARLREDFEVARRVQRRLMRQHLPEGLGLSAYTEYLPACDVGGDFYSVAPSDDGRIGVAIGDVSGKGVSAALVMSRVSADMQRALASGKDPAATLRALNAELQDVDAETFVTAACLQLDAAARRLVVSNAGHLPLVVRRATGHVFTCGSASGTPIGMLPSGYEDETVTLEPSDIVVLASDGVLEALDWPGGGRGIASLVELVQAAPHDGELVSAHLRAAMRELHAARSRDDATWVVLQLDR